jgi:hypothetical protein
MDKNYEVIEQKIVKLILENFLGNNIKLNGGTFIEFIILIMEQAETVNKATGQQKLIIVRNVVKQIVPMIQIDENFKILLNYYLSKDEYLDDTVLSIINISKGLTNINKNKFFLNIRNLFKKCCIS